MALELVGAIGLLIPATATAAALCLAILMIVMFPANLHLARTGSDLDFIDYFDNCVVHESGAFTVNRPDGLSRP